MIFLLVALASQGVHAKATKSRRGQDVDDEVEVEKKPAGSVTMKRDLSVGGSMTVGTLDAQNVTAAGNLMVEGEIRALSMAATTANTGYLQTSLLKSPTGTILVKGDLIITSADVDPSVSATAFIAESVTLGGVAQWRLVRHEHFDQEEEVEGWSLMETSSCSAGSKDAFLGGHCKTGDNLATKTFENLPEHTQIKVAARYHFIDNWQGETAFLKLDGEHVWTQGHGPVNPAHGIEMCGSSKFKETKFSAPVEVSQAHTNSMLEVSFGSTSHDENDDPCSRSFGVDDVMIYVK